MYKISSIAPILQISSDLLLKREGDSPLYPGCNCTSDWEVEHHSQVSRPSSVRGPKHRAGIQTRVRGVVTRTQKHRRHPNHGSW